MIRKNWQPYAAAAAVAAICFVATGISTARPTSVTSSQGLAPMETVTTQPNNGILFYPDIEAEEEAARNYMRSDERIRQFESDFAMASMLVASGLDSGWFGDITFRYNSDKQARPSGYAGWGGIATPDQSWFAAMTWQRSGAIDYKAGVTEIAVTVGDTVLSIAADNHGEGPYRILLNDGEGHVHVSSTEFMQNWERGRTAESQYWPALGLDELKWIDERSLETLNSAMTAQFGENWRNARLVSTGPNAVYVTYLP